MAFFLLHENHPYVVEFCYSIVRTIDGAFEVRYRDYDTVKQECVFKTVEAARIFGEMKKQYAAVIDYDYFKDRMNDNERLYYDKPTEY